MGMLVHENTAPYKYTVLLYWMGSREDHLTVHERVSHPHQKTRENL